MIHIINYAIKSFIIIVGIVFLSGVATPANGDATLFRVMGVVFILFGVYRIILYRTKVKQYNLAADDEEDAEDEIDEAEK